MARNGSEKVVQRDGRLVNGSDESSLCASSK